MHASRYLIFSLAVITCLSSASCFAMDYVRNLFDREDVNALDVDGVTPLMRAFVAGNFNEAQRLLKKSPSLAIKALCGCTIFEIFLESRFDTHQQAILAKELILLAIGQNIFESVPDQVRNCALDLNEPGLTALLHMVAPTPKTRELVQNLSPTFAHSYILREATSWQKLAKISISSLCILWVLVYLFLEDTKLPAY